MPIVCPGPTLVSYTTAFALCMVDKEKRIQEAWLPVLAACTNQHGCALQQHAAYLCTGIPLAVGCCEVVLCCQAVHGHSKVVLPQHECQVSQAPHLAFHTVPRVGSFLHAGRGGRPAALLTVHQHMQPMASNITKHRAVAQQVLHRHVSMTNMELMPADDEPMVTTTSWCAGRASKSLAGARHRRALQWCISTRSHPQADLCGHGVTCCPFPQPAEAVLEALASSWQQQMATARSRQVITPLVPIATTG